MEKETLAAREPNMWRYRELMPLFDGEQPADARRGLDAAHSREASRPRPRPVAPLRQGRVAQPTNSFKARGLAAAVTKASLLGAKTLSIPSAGNAANAMAAYAAAAGSRRRSSCRRT
jgi:threonine synthase